MIHKKRDGPDITWVIFASCKEWKPPKRILFIIIKLAAIVLDPQENPISFIERLREVLIKYTNLDPNDPAEAIV